jgi:hypothetical protein
MTDFEQISKTINELWFETYKGGPVFDLKALQARVIGIFDDRNCWMDNAKANNKEYLKLEKKLKRYENGKI